MRLQLLILLVLASIGASRAFGGDAPAPPPGSPADAAREAAAAVEAGDKAALARLAGDGGTATLDIIDAALGAGDAETAKALAAAAPEPFTKPLQSYADGRGSEFAPKAIGSMHEVAKRLLAADRTEDGARVYGRAASFSAAAADVRGVAASRIYESRALLSLERAKDALAAADSALAAATGPGALLAPRAHLARGNALVALDRDADSLDAFADAVAGFRAAQDDVQAAETLRRIGEQHEKKGRLRLALSAFETAVEVARPTGKAETLGGALNAVAMVRDDLGDMADALRAYDESRALFERSGDELLAAISGLNLGVARLRLEDDARALEAFTKSRDTFRRLGQRGYEMQALANLATVSDRAGRHEEALAGYGEVLAFAVETKDARLEARTHGNRGLALKGLGRLGEALTAYRSQRTLARRLGVRELEMGALIFEAGVHEKAGRSDEALATFRTASDVAGPEATPLTRLRIETGTAALLLGRNDAAGALAAVRRALLAARATTRGLSEVEGAQARQHLVALYELGVEAARQSGDAVAVVEMTERGRAGVFREALTVKRRAASRPREALARDLEEAAKAEAAALGPYRAALASGLRSDIRESREKAEAASRRADDVRARLEREEKAAAGSIEESVDGATDIRARLAPGESLVLYALLRDRDALAVVLRRDEARVVPLAASAVVEAAAEAAAGSGGLIDAAKVEELRRLVVTPLALPESAHRVLVSADGPLWTVPLSLLFPGFDSAAIPSGTVLGMLRAATSPRGEGVLALGDPSFPASARLPALPATRAEVERIGTTRLLGGDATKARLVEALVSRPRWLALHLATHGLLDEENPLRSSLAMSADPSGDYQWTAADVLSTPVAADVVVLSACETGRGRHFRAEGVLGLTRSFLIAGAQRVIASLWKVDDEATAALMTRFYERFAPKDGIAAVDAATALRLAQDDIRKDPRWTDPRYWAAWILVGLP